MKHIDLKPGRYRAPNPQKEPFLLPGAKTRILGAVIVAFFVVGVAVVTSPIGDFGYWISCHFITGTCR